MNLSLIKCHGNRGLRPRAVTDPLFGRIGVIAVFSMAVLVSEPVSLAADTRSNLILLLEQTDPNAQSTRFEDLRMALEAHLASYGMAVHLVQLRAIPRNRRAQEEKALALAEAGNARGAIWLDLRHQTVSMVFLDKQGQERQLRRQFHCDSSNVAVCGDAIASVVNSALLSWEGDTFSNSEKQDVEIVYIEDNELNPIPLENLPWEKPRHPVWLLVNGGWGFQFFKGTQQFTHGLRLGVGAIVALHLAFEISTDLLLPIRAQTSVVGETAKTLVSVPLRVLAGGVLPLDQWSIGLLLGLGINFVGIQESSDPFFANGVEKTIPGFASTLTVKYAFLDWLAAWVEAGLDVDKFRIQYVEVDPNGVEATLFRYGAVHGRVSLGLAVLFRI